MHQNLLLVDDDPVTLSTGIAHMKQAGFSAQGVTTLGAMKEAVSAQAFDAVILDLMLDREDGLDGIPWLLKHSPWSRIYVLTSHASVASAVACMKSGATSFFSKNDSWERIVEQISMDVNARAEKELAIDNGAGFHGIIGQSDAVTDLIATINRLKDVDSTVLILGESGTGKELVARAVHAVSARAANRFDAINCGAIPENLLESELFGHKKGAFTDAKADRKGIFEVCNKGTLLLDEIGDMPPALQTKLLRVLQERSIMPIGSSQIIPVDTRVIAATHRDILDECRSRRFREDLYYRLSVLVIRIPPLRHRVEDVPVLVNHFLDVFNRKFERSIKPPRPSLMSRLMAYDWPGNIRELQNAVERGVVLATSDELQFDVMFQHLYGDDRHQTSAASMDPAIFTVPLSDAKQQFERIYLENLLTSCGGNISEAARISGRYRADIYRLIHRFGLDQHEFRH